MPNDNSYEKELKKEIASAPTPNPTKIVFKWSQDQSKFIKSRFSPSNSEYQISEQDIDKILKSLKQSKYYKLSTFDITVFLPILLILFIAVMVGATVYLAASGMAWLTPVVWMLLIVAFGGTFQVIVSCLKEIERNRYGMRRGDFERIIQGEVARLYSLLGVVWKVGRFGAWLSFEVPRAGVAAVNGVSQGYSEQVSRPHQPYSETQNLNLGRNQIVPFSANNGIPIAQPVAAYLPTPYNPQLMTHSGQKMETTQEGSEVPPIIERYVDRENGEPKAPLLAKKEP